MSVKLTPGQLESLRSHWGIKGEPRFHRRVANFVYFAEAEGREVVLRLTEPGHRSAAEIEAELDWMDYLGREGLALARPVRSRRGSLVESLSGAETFHATVFEKLSGSSLRDSSTGPGPETLRNWGQYLGRMHKLTRAYLPSPGVQRRQEWDRDATLAEAKLALDPADGPARSSFLAILEELETLPRGDEDYGLVHCDLHPGNFFVNSSGLTAFDFDDCCYHWFAYDLIPPLNSMESMNEDLKWGLSFETMRGDFLAGYLSEYPLTQEWLDRLPLFRRFRAAVLYHWVRGALSKGVFDEKGREWAREALPQMRTMFTQY